MLILFPIDLSPVTWFAHLVHTLGPHLPAKRRSLDELSQRPIDRNVEELILRDLGRTFPNCLYFAERQGQGQYALYRILRAYAAMDPKVRWTLFEVTGQ